MLLQIAMHRMIVIIMHATARIRNMIMVLTLEFWLPTSLSCASDSESSTTSDSVSFTVSTLGL